MGKKLSQKIKLSIDRFNKRKEKRKKKLQRKGKKEIRS